MFEKNISLYQLKEWQENMSESKRTRNEVVGDTVLDLGKLTFGGIVLAGIFDSSMNKIVLVTAGLVFCIILIIIGIYLTTKKDKEE